MLSRVVAATPNKAESLPEQALAKATRSSQMQRNESCPKPAHRCEWNILKVFVASELPLTPALFRASTGQTRPSLGRAPGSRGTQATPIRSFPDDQFRRRFSEVHPCHLPYSICPQ